MWKVGELAAEAGLTVRTLHHYDRIGLVRPAGRTYSGHRRYNEADVQRLYQVLALRQLGLGLDQIAKVLAGKAEMAQVLAAHRDYLAAQLATTQDLHARVAALAATAKNRPDISGNHFLALIRRTVGNTRSVGPEAILEQLLRFPQAEYVINAIDLHANAATSALLRLTGNRTPDNSPTPRPFATSFTLTRSSPTDAYLISNHTFHPTPPASLPLL